MTQFSVFTAPIFALFSADFYRDVGRNWRGKAFLYVLLLEMVVWIPIMFVWSTAINKFVADEADQLAEQIPPVSINKGVAVVHAEQPHFIRMGDPAEDVAILDTTGEITSLDDTTAQLLLTKDKLIVKKNKLETREYDLKDADDFAIDGPTVRSWADTAAEWAPFALYPFLVFMEFLWRVVQALIYALIGLVINSVTDARMDFGGILSICLTSATATILFGTILRVLQTDFPLEGFVGFGLSVGYIAFGISSNRGYVGEDIMLPQGDL